VSIFPARTIDTDAGGGFSLDTATGALSGAVEFPQGSVGIGSSFRSAEINWYDFKSGGPLQASLSGTATASAAVGTLALKLYKLSKPAKHGKRAKKHAAARKRTLAASCQISFDAPNLYAPASGAPEEPAPTTPEDGE
jgi:hypothetical protein